MVLEFNGINFHKTLVFSVELSLSHGIFCGVFQYSTARLRKRQLHFTWGLVFGKG